MSLLLELAAIVLLVVFALILAVLLIPFELSLEASKAGASQKGTVLVRWLGLTLWRSKPGESKEPIITVKKQESRKQQQKSRSPFDLGRFVRILGLIRDSSSSLLTIIQSFRRAVSIRRLSVDVTFGLGDPADTALAAGYVWSVAWLLNLSPAISFSIQPDMENFRLDGSVLAQLRLRLLPIVLGFMRAYFHRSFRQLIKEVRS